MYNKILCLAMAFALSISVWAEDLKSVMSFYKPDMSKGFIFVSKVDMTLTLVNSQGKVVVTYPIACGKRSGQKSKPGDNKTPEGYFLLQRIHDASNWGHDFHDGKGFIENAYGPYFLRLKTGFDGIGIHGTHAPSSIGTRATEGCIRLANEDIAALEHKVKLGMPVIIGPEEGVAKLIASNAKRPNLPYWTTGTSTPVKQKPKPTPKPKVVNDNIDIDPERDLIDAAVETSAKTVVDEVKAPEQKSVEEIKVPVQKPAKVEQPAEAVKSVEVEKPVEVVTPIEVENPVEVVEEKPAEHVGEPVETIAKEETKEAEPIQVEMVVDKAEGQTSSSDKAPQYEVVVEEVTAPDGTVKYEVHYKPIK